MSGTRYRRRLTFATAQTRGGIPRKLDRVWDYGGRRLKKNLAGMVGPIEIKFESHVESRSWDGCAGGGGGLRMPAISNTIRQMDQRAAGLHRAKSSRSRDQWISVNPTEKRGGRGGLGASRHMLPYHFPFSFTLPSLPMIRVASATFTITGPFSPVTSHNELDEGRKPPFLLLDL